MRRLDDKRGNNLDRAARKRWMLETWGDGSQCSCVHCARALTYATVESDRIVPGDTYRRDNVQPSCRACNAARGDDPTWTKGN